MVQTARPASAPSGRSAPLRVRMAGPDPGESHGYGPGMGGRDAGTVRLRHTAQLGERELRAVRELQSTYVWAPDGGVLPDPAAGPLRFDWRNGDVL